MSLREKFLALDDALAQHGVPPLTAWWRDGIGSWLDAYEGGHVLELWACVGRGAAKSTALYKLALFFACFGDFTVPPGERHFAIVLSRLKEEAAKGVSIISAWLRLLGIAHRPAGDVIELEELPRGIRVVAASVAASSGWRAFFVAKDERSKWASGGAEELDAEEVDTSASAMTATHPYAPIVIAGSAWGNFGAFYDAITAGTTDARVVLGPTPTWVAAPHILEEDCRRKERDPRKFAREYQCVFQASASCAFDIDAIDRAFSRGIDGATSSTPVLIVDPSSGGADAFTYCLARWMHRPQTRYLTKRVWVYTARRWVDVLVRDDAGRAIENPDYQVGADAPLLRLDRFGAFEGGYWGKMSGSTIVEKIAAFAKSHGVTRAYGDQRERLMLTSEFARHGITYMAIDWTAVNKPPAVELVRRWMRDDTLSLEPNPKLRAELLAFEEKITPSGQVTFAARGRNHDDRVALLVTSAIADAEGGLPASPTGPHVRRSIPASFTAV